MTKHGETYNRMSRNFLESSDLEEVVQDLRNLGALQNSGDISTKERYQLQVDAFHSLRNLTSDSPDIAESIILQELLPHCVKTEQEAGPLLFQHRECLTEWLEDYPQDIRSHLRSKVYRELYGYFDSSNPVGAFYTASHIGYRSDELVAALEQITDRRDDKAGDVAVSTLAGLGLSKKRRKEVLSELHRRAAARFNRTLVSALARLSDPSSIDVVVDHWLKARRSELEPVNVSLIFNIPQNALDAHAGNSAIQDRTWELLAELVDEEPERFFQEFFGTKFAQNCNSPQVIPKMLEWYAEKTAERKNPEWTRYLLCRRAEECVRPRQLEGWKNAHSESILRQLIEDVSQDTGTDGKWVTVEMDKKEQAWMTILRLGDLRALYLFDQAVLPETSRFVQQHIIETLACFKLKSLPDIIKRWITETFDDQLDDSREFVRRMAAFRLARSAATREAFDTLLNFGFTGKGKVMLQSADALAEVASHLAAVGDDSVVDALIQTIVTRHEPNQSIAAATALERVAALDGSLLEPRTEKIIPLLHEDNREPFERGPLIRSLAYIDDWKAPEDLLNSLQVWAKEPDRWIGGGSLELLARQGYLHRHPDLLNDVLGLKRVDDKWDLGDKTLSEWAPYFIGMLYHYYPNSFLPAVVSIIARSRWHSAAQVIQWLIAPTGDTDTKDVPLAIKNALVQRVREKQSTSYSEPESFEVLANLAPNALVSEPWDDMWHGWLPDSRVALANALGKADLDSEDRDAAISLLKILILDGNFAVRRAAYRGLASQSTQALYTECLAWAARATTLQLRQRAAEAYAWLDPQHPDVRPSAFEKLRQTLLTDPERIVRETAERVSTPS